jgi:hypothetical protein
MINESGGEKENLEKVSVLSFINYVDEYYKKTYIVCRWLGWTVSRQQLTSLGKCIDLRKF